jgi:hypothetical protein
MVLKLFTGIGDLSDLKLEGAAMFIHKISSSEKKTGIHDVKTHVQRKLVRI